MITLIGGENTKRYDFFKQACDTQNVQFNFCHSMDVLNDPSRLDSLQGMVKIEPLSIADSDISNSESHVRRYFDFLTLIESRVNNQTLKPITTLNSPSAIKLCLDKKQCKRRLMALNIPTTELIDERFTSFDDLVEYMRENKVLNVFIKPNLASGASGILALKLHPSQNKLAMATSAHLMSGKLVNTKRIKKIIDISTAKDYVNLILAHDYIVEKWKIKDKHQGKSYDLRVVCQFGQIDFIVGRLSNSPITNLHLNNDGILGEDLDFSAETLKEIEKICASINKNFDGLNSFGVDILIDRNKHAFVIEINAQGDHIYKDLYGDNVIYNNQVKHLNSRKEK